ncbi:hypothetical protein PRK78_003362 [Emydomyces testavorans]|uniref:Involucrin repeat protein n=1 Tax=Emydomyces testavorans TaxID=2070801 RepID=A0AAF0IHE3_9EURO|nr:hypothetical protein PRK78_003362 [Emydomyces testavorans]
MLRSLLGKSSNRSTTSSTRSEGRRHRRRDRDRDEDSTPSSSRSKTKNGHDTFAPSSSGRKSTRGDDRGLDIDPVPSTYSVPSHRSYPESEARSTVSSSYVTADPGEPVEDDYDNFQPRRDLGFGETDKLGEDFQEQRSLRSEARRQERRVGDETKNEGSECLRNGERDQERDERRRRRKEREVAERRDKEPEEGRRRRRRTEGGSTFEETSPYSSFRDGLDPVESHIAESLPRGFTQHDRGTAPAAGVVPSLPHSTQPPGPMPQSPTYGLAAEYYNDQGESVSAQPGVRPAAPQVIAGTQPHLMSPLETPAPPVEPSALGQAGAAASFYDVTSAQSSQPLNVPAPPTQPSKPQIIPPSSPATYGIDPALLNDHSSHQTQLPSQTTSTTGSQSYTNGYQQHFYSSPSHSGMTAMGAAAGLAAASGLAYSTAHHRPPQSSHAQYQPGTLEYHRNHHGPLRRLIDFWKDTEGVAQFEEYSEIIGVCKYCFEPGTTSRDAPRTHHYRRRDLYDPRTSRNRVDKRSRYASSDDDSQRNWSNRKSWLAGSLAAYLGKSIYDRTRSSIGDGSSTRSRRSRDSRSPSSVHSHSSLGTKSRTFRGTTKVSNRSHSPSLLEDRYTEFRVGDSNTYGLPPETTPAKSHYSARTRRSGSRTSFSSGSTRGSELQGAALAAAAIGVAASSSKARRRSRSRSPGKPRRRRYSSSSSSGSLIDISRPSRSRGLAGLSYFFTAPSERRAKSKTEKPKKKGRGFFSFRSVSSSSDDADADLAFGSGFYKATSRKSKRGKQDDHDLDAKLLNLGGTAISLADTASRLNERRRPDVIAVKEMRHRDQSDRRESKYTSIQKPDDDDGWESVSESSLDSTLAYGESSDSGTSKWGWGWGWGKKRQSNAATLEKQNFPPAERPYPTPIQNGPPPTDSYTSLPSMHNVFPISTSDPSRFDAATESSVSTSAPSRPQEPFHVSQTKRIPLDQPQPIAPVSHSVYTQAEAFPIYSTTVDATTKPAPRNEAEYPLPAVEPFRDTFETYQSRRNEFNGRHPRVSRKEGSHRRRDSSPVFPTKRSDMSGVKFPKRSSTSQVQFDLTQEQVEKELRLQRLEEERETRRRERVSHPSSEYIPSEVEVSSRRDRKPEWIDIHSKGHKAHGDETSDLSWSVPVGAAIGAASIPTILSAVNDKKSDKRREERREKRRKDDLSYSESDEDGPPASKANERRFEADDEAAARRRRRIAIEATKRIIASPVYESYVEYFTPDDVRSAKSSPRSDASSDLQPMKESPKVLFDRENSGIPEGLDTRHLPWPVPRLNLIEPTPPHSTAGSLIAEDVISKRPAEENIPTATGLDEVYDFEASHKEAGEVRDDSSTKEGRTTVQNQVAGLGIDSEPISREETIEAKLEEPSAERIPETPEVEYAEESDTSSVEEVVSQRIPGGFEDDIEFAATLAAGARLAGFDPAIITEDPTYHRRTSPPGSESEDTSTSPMVFEFGEPFTGRSGPSVHGFIEPESLPASDTEEEEETRVQRSPPPHAAENEYSKVDPQQETDSYSSREAAYGQPTGTQRPQMHQVPEDSPLVDKDEAEAREFFDAAEDHVFKDFTREEHDSKGNALPDHKQTRESQVFPKSVDYEQPASQSLAQGQNEKGYHTVPGTSTEPEPEPTNTGNAKRKSKAKKKRDILEADDLESGTFESQAGEFDGAKPSMAIEPSEAKSGFDSVVIDPLSSRVSRAEELESEPKEHDFREEAGVPGELFPSISTSGDRSKNEKLKRSRFQGPELTDITSKSMDKVAKPAEAELLMAKEGIDKDTDKAATLPREQPYEDIIDEPDQRQKRKNRKKDRRNRYEDIVESSKQAKAELVASVAEPVSKNDPLIDNKRSASKSFLDDGPGIPLKRDGVSGIELGTQHLANSAREPTTPVTSIPVQMIFSPRARSRSSSPLPFPKADVPQLPHSRPNSPSPNTTRARQISVRGDSDLNPVVASSPTAVPLHFRRPFSSHGSPATVPSPVPGPAPVPSSPITTKGHKRPKSTEFKIDRELRPLWLVERHSSAKTGSQQEESYPSLPSSRTASRTPSIENIRAGNQVEFAYDQPMLPPRRQPVLLQVDTDQGSQNEDISSSRQATPTAATFQQAQKKDVPKHLFHSPSELLMEPFDSAFDRMPALPPYPSAVPILDQDLPPLPESIPSSPCTETDSWRTAGERSSIGAESDITAIPDSRPEYSRDGVPTKIPDSGSRPSTALSAYESAVEFEEPGTHTPVPTSPASVIALPVEDRAGEVLERKVRGGEPYYESPTGVNVLTDFGATEIPIEDGFEETQREIGLEPEMLKGTEAPQISEAADVEDTICASQKTTNDDFIGPNARDSVTAAQISDSDRYVTDSKDTEAKHIPLLSKDETLVEMQSISPHTIPTDKSTITTEPTLADYKNELLMSKETPAGEQPSTFDADMIREPLNTFPQEKSKYVLENDGKVESTVLEKQEKASSPKERVGTEQSAEVVSARVPEPSETPFSVMPINFPNDSSEVARLKESKVHHPQLIKDTSSTDVIPDDHNAEATEKQDDFPILPQSSTGGKKGKKKGRRSITAVEDNLDDFAEKALPSKSISKAEPANIVTAGVTERTLVEETQLPSESVEETTGSSELPSQEPTESEFAPITRRKSKKGKGKGKGKDKQVAIAGIHSEKAGKLETTVEQPEHPLSVSLESDGAAKSGVTAPVDELMPSSQFISEVTETTGDNFVSSTQEKENVKKALTEGIISLEKGNLQEEKRDERLYDDTKIDSEQPEQHFEGSHDLPDMVREKQEGTAKEPTSSTGPESFLMPSGDAEKSRQFQVEETPKEEKRIDERQAKSLDEQLVSLPSESRHKTNDVPIAGIAQESTEATDTDFAPVLSKKDKKQKRRSKKFSGDELPMSEEIISTDDKTGEDRERKSDTDLTQASEPHALQESVSVTGASEADFTPAPSKKDKKKKRKDKQPPANEAVIDNRMAEEEAVKSLDTERVSEPTEQQENTFLSETAPGSLVGAIEADGTELESIAIKKTKKKRKGKQQGSKDAFDDNPDLAEQNTEPHDLEAIAEATEVLPTDGTALLADTSLERAPIDLIEATVEPVSPARKHSEVESDVATAENTHLRDELHLNAPTALVTAAETQQTSGDMPSVDTASTTVFVEPTEAIEADFAPVPSKKGRKTKGKGKQASANDILPDVDTRQLSDASLDVSSASEGKRESPDFEMKPLPAKEAVALPAPEATKADFAPLTRKKSKKGRGEAKENEAESVLKQSDQPLETAHENEKEIPAERTDATEPFSAETQVQEEPSSRNNILPEEVPLPDELEDASNQIDTMRADEYVPPFQLVKPSITEEAQHSRSMISETAGISIEEPSKDDECTLQSQESVPPDVTTTARDDAKSPAISKNLELVPLAPEDETAPVAETAANVPAADFVEPPFIMPETGTQLMKKAPDTDNANIALTSEEPVISAENSDLRIPSESPSMHETLPIETPIACEPQEQVSESPEGSALPKMLPLHPSGPDASTVAETANDIVEEACDKPKASNKGETKSQNFVSMAASEIPEPSPAEPLLLKDKQPAADTTDIAHVTQNEAPLSTTELECPTSKVTDIGKSFPGDSRPGSEAANAANKTLPHVPNPPHEETDILLTAKPSKKLTRKDKKKQKALAASQESPVTDAVVDNFDVYAEASQNQDFFDPLASKSEELQMQVPEGNLQSELVEQPPVGDVEPVSAPLTSEVVEEYSHQDFLTASGTESHQLDLGIMNTAHEEPPLELAARDYVNVASEIPVGEVVDDENQETENPGTTAHFEEIKRKREKKGKKGKKRDSTSWEKETVGESLQHMPVESDIEGASLQASTKETGLEEPKTAKAKRKAKKEKRKQRQSAAWEDEIPSSKSTDPTKSDQAAHDVTEEPVSNVEPTVEPDSEETKSNKTKRGAKKDKKKRHSDWVETTVIPEQSARTADLSPHSLESDRDNDENSEVIEVPVPSNDMQEENQGEGIQTSKVVECKAALDIPEEDGKEFQSSKKKKRKSKKNAKTTDWTDDIPREQVMTEPADQDHPRSQAAEVPEISAAAEPDVQNQNRDTGIATDSGTAHAYESYDLSKEDPGSIAEDSLPMAIQQFSPTLEAISEIPLPRSPPEPLDESSKKLVSSISVADGTLKDSEERLRDLQTVLPENLATPNVTNEGDIVGYLSADANHSGAFPTPVLQGADALPTGQITELLTTLRDNSEEQDERGQDTVPGLLGTKQESLSPSIEPPVSAGDIRVPFTAVRSPELQTNDSGEGFLGSVSLKGAPELMLREHPTEGEAKLPPRDAVSDRVAETQCLPTTEELSVKPLTFEHNPEDKVEGEQQTKDLNIKEETCLGQLELDQQQEPRAFNEEDENQIGAGEWTEPNRKKNKKNKKSRDAEDSSLFPESSNVQPVPVSTTKEISELSEGLAIVAPESSAHPASKKGKGSKRKKEKKSKVAAPGDNIYESKDISQQKESIEVPNTQKEAVSEAMKDETTEEGTPETQDLRPELTAAKAENLEIQGAGLKTEAQTPKMEPVLVQRQVNEEPETDQPTDGDIAEVLATNVESNRSKENLLKNFNDQPTEKAVLDTQALEPIIEDRDGHPAEQALSKSPIVKRQLSPPSEDSRPAISDDELCEIPAVSPLHQDTPNILLEGPIQSRVPTAEGFVEENTQLELPEAPSQSPDNGDVFLRLKSPSKMKLGRSKTASQETLNDSESPDEKDGFTTPGEEASAFLEESDVSKKELGKSEGEKESPKFDDKPEAPSLKKKAARHLSDHHRPVLPEAPDHVKPKEDVPRDDDSLPSITWDSPKQGMDDISFYDEAIKPETSSLDLQLSGDRAHTPEDTLGAEQSPLFGQIEEEIEDFDSDAKLDAQVTVNNPSSNPFLGVPNDQQAEAQNEPTGDIATDSGAIEGKFQIASQKQGIAAAGKQTPKLHAGGISEKEVLVDTTTRENVEFLSTRHGTEEMKEKRKQQDIDECVMSEELGVKPLFSTAIEGSDEVAILVDTPDSKLMTDTTDALHVDKVITENATTDSMTPPKHKSLKTKRDTEIDITSDSSDLDQLSHQPPKLHLEKLVKPAPSSKSAGLVTSVFPHLERVPRKVSQAPMKESSKQSDLEEAETSIEDDRPRQYHGPKENETDVREHKAGGVDMPIVEQERRNAHVLESPIARPISPLANQERTPHEQGATIVSLRQPPSLFGGPYGLAEQIRARSPPKTPLATIEEQSPMESPSHTRYRDVSDVGSPERGVKVAKLEREPSPVTFRPDKLHIGRRRVSSDNLKTAPLPAEPRSFSGPLENTPRTPDKSEIIRPARIVSLESIKSTDSLHLRRSAGSGDLRAQSKFEELGGKNESPAHQPEEENDVNIEAIPSSSTYDPVTDKGKLPLRGMAADVLEGWGDVPGSPLSPSRPPSVRRRRSLQHLQDLETRLDQLASENRLLSTAKVTAEKSLETQTITQRQYARNLEAREREIQDKDCQIRQLKKSTQWLQKELAKLTELNEGLTATNVALQSSQERENSQHIEVAQQWQRSREELEDLRAKYSQLSAGMESMVNNQVDTALAEKNAEIGRLREELVEAQNKIKELQEKIIASSSDDVITFHDEDYFEAACQKLCHHVQQWVLRFSKFSDMRLCRLTSTLRDETVAERFENAILDGSDVNSYLADRVKRRDVFMSVVMTMMWDYIFTRYLFGMDREQRQKLKTLEKQLSEVGPPAAVQRWRATTLSLLAKRPAFQDQRAQDTEAVVQEIYRTLAKLLPPSQELEQSILNSLRKVMKAAVGLSIEMRTQKAEYIMLPPLRPEYDTNGDLVRKVHFNADLMNERSGETTSNEQLEEQQAIVRIVLFPLVVKKGSDEGEGDEEIVVCPAQVLVARPGKDKKVVRVLSGDRLSANPVSQSIQSFPSEDMDTSTMI